MASKSTGEAARPSATSNQDEYACTVCGAILLDSHSKTAGSSRPAVLKSVKQTSDEIETHELKVISSSVPVVSAEGNSSLSSSLKPEPVRPAPYPHPTPNPNPAPTHLSSDLAQQNKSPSFDSETSEGTLVARSSSTSLAAGTPSISPPASPKPAPLTINTNTTLPTARVSRRSTITSKFKKKAEMPSKTAIKAVAFLLPLVSFLWVIWAWHSNNRSVELAQFANLTDVHALELAEWTAKKDYLNYCQQLQVSSIRFLAEDCLEIG
jgi:hypothetical protein